jgi:hypothetical protein
MSTKAMALAFALSLIPAAVADNDFKPIFDGRTLSGWETPEPFYWTIEDGAITGRITKDRPCNTNQYLVWTGGELADFELKLKSRLNGESVNNGFQFRSRLLPDHDVCGYQVDNNLKTDWLVRLYDEYGRHDLAFRGQRTIYEKNGDRVFERIHEPADPAWFKLEDWHDYHLICVSNKITLSINGRLAAEVEDNDPRRFEPQGIFALQLHSGPPTVVQFKDIELKILKPAAQLPKSPRLTTAQINLQKEAAAWWPLDAGGHGAQRWLRLNPAFYQFEMNVRAAGPRATPNGNVILMQGAHFEADPTLLSETKAFTLHLRARDPESKWIGALITKQNAFALTASTNLVFTVGGNQLTAAISGDRDAWQDITARYDRSSLTLFQNGVRIANLESTRNPAPLAKNSSPLLISAAFANGKIVNQFTGELEFAALWSRALSDREVSDLCGGR